MTHLIYSVTDKRAVPVGYVIGDIYQATRMICLNRYAPSIRLRTLNPGDKPRLDALNWRTNHYATVKLGTRFNLGAMMGASGLDCFHFTVRSWVLACVPAVKVVLAGAERTLTEDGRHHILVDGDVRLIFDQERCWIYLLRGTIYNQGKILGQNRENNCSLKMVQNSNAVALVVCNRPDQVDSQQPTTTTATRKHQQESNERMAAAAAAGTNGGTVMYFIGYLNGVKHERKPMALITGSVYPAPMAAYNFGQSSTTFDLVYTPMVDTKLRNRLDSSENVVCLIPVNEATVMIYSTTGEGVQFHYGTEAKIESQLLLIDQSNGNLAGRRDGRLHIRITSGTVRLYVCDDNLILLLDSNGSKNVQIGPASEQPPPPPLPLPSKL